MPAIDIYVKIAGGKTCELRFDASRKVEDIYLAVAEKEHVSRDRVLVKYAGKVLDSTLTIDYTGIRTETILKAEVVDVRDWSLSAKLPSGEVVPVKVSNVGKISDVIEEIESKVKSSRKQILKFGGRTLNDGNMKVMNSGFTDGSVIEVCTVEAEEVEAVEEVEDKSAILQSFDAAGKPVEVVFSFDTTGSMSSCLQKVREDLRGMVRSLLERVPLIRIGIIAHGDYCDDASASGYAIRTKDLTSDVDALAKFVDQVPSTSGGDSPECYEWVLHRAQQMDWSEISAKALVVIGDCEPHPPSYTDQSLNWHDELDILKGMGIKVYGVRAMNAAYSKPFYEELADVTGGAYVEFKNVDIIKEMFLAVCYREASDEQFEAFCDEVLASENSSESKKEEIKEVFKQLNEQETEKDKVNKQKRYVSAAWWDVALDSGRPSYRYISDTDRWIACTQSTDDRTVSSPISAGLSETRGSSFMRKHFFSKSDRSFRLGRSHVSKPRGRCEIM